MNLQLHEEQNSYIQARQDGRNKLAYLEEYISNQNGIIDAKSIENQSLYKLNQDMQAQIDNFKMDGSEMRDKIQTLLEEMKKMKEREQRYEDLISKRAMSESKKKRSVSNGKTEALSQ